MRDKIWKTVTTLMMNSNDLRYYQISVADLCKELDIHRSTFYRYFNSKYELLDYGISQLWKDYIHAISTENLQRPFQYAADFFDSSTAKELIVNQKNDTEFLADIKRITLSYLERQYKVAISSNADFYAAFIISSIDFLDLWNQKQQMRLSPQELDSLFQSIVLSEQIKFIH